MNVNILLVLHKLVKIYSNLMKSRIKMSSMHSSCDIIHVLLIYLICCNSHTVLYLKLYFFIVRMGNCHTVGPNEALVISGGCCGNEGKKYIVGGYGWAWCLVTETQRLSLEIMTLLPSVSNCESKKG